MQDYIHTDHQLHWLSQVIAKANRSFVPAREDDSHTSLFYDPIGNRMMGRWIEAPPEIFILTFNLSNFHFEWLNDRLHIVESVSTLEKNKQELEQEIARFIAAQGLDVSCFSKALHFEIPDYGFQHHGIAAVSKAGLEQWRYFRKLANTMCSALSGFLQASGETRIWPHHFDTGIYTQANKNLGIGFGLAMEDKLAGQPYFYLSGYPPQGTIDYSGLPLLSRGRWETGEHWKGAILPIEEVPIFSIQSEQVVFQFIEETLSWFLGRTG